MVRIIIYGILFIAVIVACIYVMSTVLWAKAATTLAPRADFNLCDRHGLYQRKDAIILTLPDEFDTDRGLLHEYPECPFCFEEKMKNAEEILKKKG